METPVLGPNTTQSGDDNDRLWKNPVLGPNTTQSGDDNDRLWKPRY